MASVSFLKLVTALIGGVGCLGMGSVAIGHKALGISELPETPNQQKREVRASGHKIVIYRYPLFGQQYHFRLHARTVSQVSYLRSATLHSTAPTVVELSFSLTLAFKLKKRFRDLALAAADSVALGG